MADTSIEWTQRTWNPIVGCSIVSPGCTNCYAMAIAERFKHAYVGRPFVGAPAEAMTRKVNGKPVWTGQLTLAPERTMLEPLRRRKPTTWFVNSMGDLFHEAVPDEWIDKVFAVMALTPQHTYQVLTKRSARMRAYVETARQRIIIGNHVAVSSGRNYYSRKLLGADWPWPLPNVWLGVSAEDQRRADERIPDLLATPAAIRFVSAEPLLGPIDFTGIATQVSSGKHVNTGMLNALSGAAAWHPTGVDDQGRAFIQRRDFAKLDWIIVGGESGREARPMHPDWARSIRDQCAAAGTAFFFKQWGEWAPSTPEQAHANPRSGWRCLAGHPHVAKAHELYPENGAAFIEHIGKKRAGRLVDGVQHDAMPERPR
ncbi:phage Gp37/Gp68 family protein [Bosea eneae]|uniref:Phage Gp37/Gp68 family protein n=1 Tax=Bosea eneae TaxID=151454 RepID=A0ABW0IZJ0_9HYPH